MLKRLLTAFAVTAAAGLMLADTASADMTGREIMNKADKHNRAKDETVSSEMRITTGAGRKMTRGLETSLKASEGDDDKSLIRVVAPTEVSGTGLLTIESGASDEQWIYLPDLRKVKRLAGASRSESFMGSDFSNYDMRTEDLAGHTYKLVGKVEVTIKKGDEKETRPCFKVEALPKDESIAEATGYSRRMVYVDAERWMVVKTEYFDKTAKPLKAMIIGEVYEVDGLWRSKRFHMRNVQEKSQTIIDQDSDSRELNQGLEDDFFTKRTLQNP